MNVVKDTCNRKKSNFDEFNYSPEELRCTNDCYFKALGTTTTYARAALAEVEPTNSPKSNVHQISFSSSWNNVEVAADAAPTFANDPILASRKLVRRITPSSCLDRCSSWDRQCRLEVIATCYDEAISTCKSQCPDNGTSDNCILNCV